MFPVSQMLVVVRAKDLDTVFAFLPVCCSKESNVLPRCKASVSLVMTSETTPCRSLLPTAPTFPPISGKIGQFLQKKTCYLRVEVTSLFYRILPLSHSNASRISPCPAPRAVSGFKSDHRIVFLSSRCRNSIGIIMRKAGRIHQPV